MSDRERMLALLDSSASDVLESTEYLRGEGRNESELWQEFESRLAPLGGIVVEVSALDGLVGKSVIVDEDAMELVAGLDWIITDDPWEAAAGITVCEFALAETGSLLLSAGAGRRRMASLAPPIHVCLVERKRILHSLQAALDRLEPRNAVLITGPSRTADIEGVLVRGVHGPRELWVLPY